ncbi:DUF5681 domain-containing protein [Bradyrhizobium sp. AZCC 2289]|uniref:DUF5681 domain-containing protein n=1 Tax=Bradyrhizobium sp. AZCC 2289 TaxID=3117026 RepID=UPI002FF28106
MPDSIQSDREESSHNRINDTEVGYKKPPKRTQFAKGRSGNPNGRPKRPDGISIKELLDSDQPGKNGTVVSKREALVVRLMNDAMAGNQKAFGRFLTFMIQAGLLRSDQSALSSVIFFDRLPPETREESNKNEIA